MVTNRETQDVAQPGQVYDASFNRILSITAGLQIEFGAAVTINDNQLLEEYFEQSKILGVAVVDPLKHRAVYDNNSYAYYDPHDNVAVMNYGTVWVEVFSSDTGVKAGETAYVYDVTIFSSGSQSGVKEENIVGMFLDTAYLTSKATIAPILIKL